jgi:hypothetical protein
VREKAAVDKACARAFKGEGAEERAAKHKVEIYGDTYEIAPSLLPIVSSVGFDSCEAACRRGLELEPGSKVNRRARAGRTRLASGAALRDATSPSGAALRDAPPQLRQVLRLKLQMLRDEGHATSTVLDGAMVDLEAAAPLKAEGNAAFAQQRYDEAAAQYTAMRPSLNLP